MTMLFLAAFLSLLYLFQIAHAQVCYFEANYEYTGGLDIPGGTIYSIYSTDQCCYQCGLNSDCQAWTFNSVTSTCTLKYGIGVRSPNVYGKSSGVRQSSATTVSGQYNCVIELDINYPANDLAGYANITTVSQCCSLCGSNSQCLGWNYARSVGYCWIKWSYPLLSNRYSFPGITSGTVIGRK